MTVITYEPGERAYEKYTGYLDRQGTGCDSWNDLTEDDRAAWAEVEIPEFDGAAVGVRQLLTTWDGLHASLDAKSREAETLNDKPHWARVRGRVAQLAYCAGQLRKVLDGGQPEPDPAVRPEPGSDTAALRAIVLAMATAIRADMLGNGRIARSDVTDWCQQAGVEFDIYAEGDDIDDEPGALDAWQAQREADAAWREPGQ